MIKVLPRNIIRFVILIFAQILIFNHIDFSRYINPYIYILFIILLPFETPRWLVLISGFILGLFIDIFMDTYGIHIIATVFIAYFRLYILNLIAPRDGYESGSYPRIYYYGFIWFLQYTTLMVISHHLILFYIEVFKLSNFFHNLLRVILSSIFSISLIVLSQYVIYRK